ncbi:PDZ domain-containing protein [Nocardioides ferulae]|uniref:YlbL family protein n=1 Tax=Nocardioides ferulae TaxID=2340821 RepID=UPI000EB56A43|nr:S16 family serine protease [Nocardioides ferulae]
MTQRTLAGLLAVPLVIGLLVAAFTQPLPYVSYEPGLTVDILDSNGESEIITVVGEQTYPDEGELRMTTVYVSRPRAEVSLMELMGDWISRDSAVYPYSAVYDEDETPEESEQEGAAEMVSSQDTAIAVALTELGYDVEPGPSVLLIEQGAPADGPLQVGDVFLAVAGEEVATADALVAAIQAAPPGEPLRFRVLRAGKEVDAVLTPRRSDGKAQIGVQVGTSYTFPFQVDVNVDPAIGGPSAGLLFALGVYDKLTPGSLTGGAIVAGTGTIAPDGSVGPIGGIQQKIAAARDAGAELFLVPPDNCEEALGAPRDDVVLVRAATMHSTVEAIEAWAEDPDADLPSCTDQ